MGTQGSNYEIGKDFLIVTGKLLGIETIKLLAFLLVMLAALYFRGWITFNFTCRFV